MTTCPSGRNDWPWLMPALEEEDLALNENTDYGTFQRMMERLVADPGFIFRMSVGDERREGSLDVIHQRIGADLLQLYGAAAATPSTSAPHDHDIPAGKTGKGGN